MFGIVSYPVWREVATFGQWLKKDVELLVVLRRERTGRNFIH